MAGLCVLIFGSAFASAACNLSSSNGIACVQSNSKTISNASSGTIAFPSNNTAGNLIVVALFANGGDTSLPTDSRNTYQAAAANQLQSPDRLSVYYAQNIGAGANTVSVSAPGATQLRVVIFEFSGLATAGALDQAAGASGTSSVPVSPSVTTTSSLELVIGAELRVSNGTISAGSGYTLELCRDSCGSGSLGTEDRILSSAQTLAATWGGGNVAKWASAIATFHAAGSPLSYGARSDNCVTGAETGCITGRTTGQANSPMSFRGQTGDPMPWYPTAGTIDPVSTAVTDPDFNSYQVMLTSGPWGNSIGFGNLGPTQNFNMGAGEQDPFSQDDSLLLVQNDQGGSALVAVNIPLVHSKGCTPSNLCVVWTGIKTATSGDSCTQGQSGTNCTVLNRGGAFSFGRAPGENYVIYEQMGTGTGANVQVNKLTVSCTAPSGFASTTCTFTRSPYVNFTSDTPTKCSVLPATYSSNAPWTGGFSAANDGSVGYSAGGAGDWSALATYTTPDSFIYPQASANNPGKYAYQATSCSGSCVQSGSEPTLFNQTVGGTTTDGNITWTNIGKIGGQGPGFDLLYFSPTRGCSRINTRIGKIYRGNGEGAGYPNGTADPAGVFVTDSVSGLFNICLLQYGTSGPYTQAQVNSCQNITSGHLTDLGTIHDGGMRVNPAYVGWTPTGAGGVPPTEFSVTQSCRGSGTTYKENVCYHHYWQVATNLVRPAEMWVDYYKTGSISGENGSHGTKGYNLQWNGTKTVSHDYIEPQYNLEGPQPVGSAHLGIQLLQSPRDTGIANAPWDEHGSGRAVNTTDTTPVFQFETAVPARGRLSGDGYPGSLAGYNEIIAMAAATDTSCDAHTLGTFCQYRFAHNWGTGSSPQFNAQNEEGMISQDGTFAAFSTDVMGTRGSTSADWTSGATHNSGDLINPQGGAGRTANANHSSFQFQTGLTSGHSSCTSSGTEPATWPQTAGATVTDGSCTWTNASGMYGSKQLPCTGLRGDYAAVAGASIPQNATVFPIANNSNSNIFQAVSSVNGFPWDEGIEPDWGNVMPYYGNQFQDSNKITWQNIGRNDCRADVVLIDLMSAHH